MERVVVTGARRHVGTTLKPMLLEQGYKVPGLDRFFFGRDRAMPTSAPIASDAK
jgi:nucleoside-diphosphate-sugar epimerase